MNRIPSFLLLAPLLTGAHLFFPVSTVGQVPATSSDSPAPAQSATPDLTIAELESALAAIETDSGIEESAKNLLASKYKQAIEALQEAETSAATATGFLEQISKAPGRSAELREQLNRLPSVESASTVPATDTIESLQKQLDSKRADLSAHGGQLSSITAESSRVEGRAGEISVRVPEAQRELADVRKQLASPEFAKDASSPVRVADRLLLQARQSKLVNELEMLKQEQSSQSVRQDLLQAQHDLLARQVENGLAAVGAFENLVRQRLTEEAKQVGSLAESAQLEVPQDDQEAQALAFEVQTLAKEFEDAVRYKQEAAAARIDLTSRLIGVTQRYEGIRKQLELGEAGGEMAQVLFELRELLTGRVWQIERTTQGLTLNNARLAGLQTDLKLEGQSDVAERYADRSSKAVRELVVARADVLQKLRTQYQELIPELTALEIEKRQYLEKLNEICADITKQLFWIRISPPVSAETFHDFPDGVRWVLKGEHWAEIGNALWSVPSRMPVRSTVVVLISSVLLLMRRRIGRALEQIGNKVRRVSTDRYAYTGQALLWTALLALPVALLFGFILSALAKTYGQSEWMQGVNRASEDLAWMIAAISIFAAVCYPGGLGAVHFKWRPDTLARFRRAVYWFGFVYAPLSLLTCSVMYADASRYLDSVGRVSFIVAHTWMAIVLWRLLQSSDGLLATRAREEPTGLMPRLRYPISALVTACPLALVVIASLGYMITAPILSFGFLVTLALVAFGVILYALTLRWFTIKYRKLALNEAIEKRRARQEAAESEGHQEETDEVIIVDEDEEELDLDSIDEQTRHLLRLLFSLGVAAVVASFWSRMLPLISVLETVTIPLTESLNLLELCQAAVIGTVTWIAMKNLPGMLELAILRATSIEAGTRNAITTLCQYAVMAAGLFLLLNVLNVDWTKFGWMAAALSVGLGFGLQEVVANFVCGLILLFERPIRVGDVVTVEGATGTVTKIYMRATTITNFDRGEVVVPNKLLITNTLVNWTLTASLNRILIPVGVAYGTDTDKARQILLDIAAEHPNVLDDPAPMATFEQFADSSLNLVLRAYLPDRSYRDATITELHTMIAQRFAAAKIEIPFPQRDLHLRNGLEPTRLAGLAGETHPNESTGDNYREFM